MRKYRFPDFFNKQNFDSKVFQLLEPRCKCMYFLHFKQRFHYKNSAVPLKFLQHLKSNMKSLKFIF